MKWILCYLDSFDYVIYKTDTSNFNESLKYEEFIKFTYKYIKGHKEFLENLNRFLTIYIDTENNIWDVYRKKFDETPFEILYELNQEENKNKDNISLYKKYIDNIFNKKYDRQNRNRFENGITIQSFFNRNRKQ